MNIERELKLLTQKIGSDELLDKILETYLEEMLEVYFYDVEKECQDSRQVLERVFSNEQKKMSEVIEILFKENMKYGIGFGFKKGLYSGFEQYFVKESTEDCFEKYAYDDLLKIPGMKKHKKYYERRTNINKLFEKIQKNLNGTASEQMTTFFCTFGEKELGVLRYSFYMGYRYALNIIEEIYYIQSINWE